MICPRKSPPFRVTNETSLERTRTASRAYYLRYPSKGSACSQAYTAIYDILTFTKTMLPSIKSHATSSGHHWLIFRHREFIIITIIQYYSLRKANMTINTTRILTRIKMNYLSLYFSCL